MSVYNSRIHRLTFNKDATNITSFVDYMQQGEFIWGLDVVMSSLHEAGIRNTVISNISPTDITAVWIDPGSPPADEACTVKAWNRITGQWEEANFELVRDAETLGIANDKWRSEQIVAQGQTALNPMTVANIIASNPAAARVIVLAGDGEEMPILSEDLNGVRPASPGPMAYIDDTTTPSSIWFWDPELQNYVQLKKSTNLPILSIDLDGVAPASPEPYAYFDDTNNVVMTWNGSIFIPLGKHNHTDSRNQPTNAKIGDTFYDRNNQMLYEYLTVNGSDIWVPQSGKIDKDNQGFYKWTSPYGDEETWRSGGILKEESDGSFSWTHSDQPSLSWRSGGGEVVSLGNNRYRWTHPEQDTVDWENTWSKLTQTGGVDAYRHTTPDGVIVNFQAVWEDPRKMQNYMDPIMTYRRIQDYNDSGNISSSQAGNKILIQKFLVEEGGEYIVSTYARVNGSFGSCNGFIHAGGSDGQYKGNNMANINQYQPLPNQFSEKSVWSSGSVSGQTWNEVVVSMSNIVNAPAGAYIFWTIEVKSTSSSFIIHSPEMRLKRLL